MDPSNPRNQTVPALIEVYECYFVMFKSIARSDRGARL